MLDIGCGPGRVAEAVIEAGAARYVGIDLSPQMLELARRRVDAHEVELIEGDFLDIDVSRTFNVVLALGLSTTWTDQSEPLPGCAPVAVLRSSHPSRAGTGVKAPLRHLHYALHRCPIFEYTEAEAEELLADAGFSTVEFTRAAPGLPRRGDAVTG